jgi:hypothetical protein
MAGAEGVTRNRGKAGPFGPAGAGSAPPSRTALFGGAIAVAPRDAAPAGGGLFGPAILEGVGSGSAVPDVAAVPRAAGMEDEARGTNAAAARGAGAGGAEGARTAMTNVRPTNPISTAATPYRKRVPSETPCFGRA